MQTYGAIFARVYNERWADFANHFAPVIQSLYEDTLQRSDRTLPGCRAKSRVTFDRFLVDDPRTQPAGDADQGDEVRRERDEQSITRQT